MAAVTQALTWVDGAPDALRDQVARMTHPAGAAVSALDATLRFVATDDEVPRQLGLSAQRLLEVRLPSVEVIGCDAEGRILEGGHHPAVIAMRTGEPVLGAIVGFEPRGERLQGFRWFRIDAWPVEADGERVGVVGHSWDITDSPEARLTMTLVVRNYQEVLAAVRADELRFRALAENSADLVYETDTRGVCVWVSPSVAQVLGWTPEEIVGRSMPELVHPDDIAEAVRLRQEAVDSGLDSGRLEMRYRTKAGGWRWMNALSRPMRDGTGRITGGLTGLRDVHADVGQRSELEYLAAHDQLTGLLNRASVTARLQEMLRDAAEQGRSVAVLYIDLDRFKAVNDAHGHQTGDRLLVQVAHRLTMALRESDVVARLGGDEFLVVLDAARDEDGYARQRALDLHAALRRPSEPGIPASTASIGLSVWDGTASAEMLIDLADQALYRAKESGRDTVST